MITIPEHYQELEQIYRATLAKNVKSLAVVSTSAGEGVSSIILGLAKRNALAGRTTLLVDLNIYNQELSTLIEPSNRVDSKTVWPSPIFVPQDFLPQNNGYLQHHHSIQSDATKNNSNIAVISAPVERKIVLSLREPGVLESYIEQWLKHFDNVLIDTSPMSHTNGNNLPPQYISSACDGTILTVLAAKTTYAALANTVNKLNKAQALVIGIVINDQFNPTLKNELLREIRRLERFFPQIANKLRMWLNNSKILALDV